MGPTWMLEIAVDDLARQMRRIAGQPEEAARRGVAGTARVSSGWTWRHATARLLERLRALQASPVPARAAPTLEVATPAPASLAANDRRAVARSRKTGRAGSKTVQNGGTAAAMRIPPTISLCMIVKNEERVLGDCLESARPWVDEIIVVDTGSEDRTVEIARQHGAKVFHFPWCDDFSAARNVSLEHATCDWLFWMDADDTLPEACGKQLHELVLLAEERVTGFLMQVHIPPAPGESGFTIVDHVKLFRNLPHLRFEGRIHEQILEPLYRQGGQVERSDLYVVHSGYDYSPEGQRRKRARDLLLLEKDLADRPEHPFVWFNIGMTAYHLKEYDRARTALEKCLAISKPHESTVRKVYAMLAGSHLEQGDPTGARDWIAQGLRRFPQDPELLFRAGSIYRECGDLAAAEQSLVRLLTAREVGHIDSLDVSMMGFKAHHNLALIYQDLGKLAEAEAQWRAALANNPGFVPSLLGLAELGLRTGQTSTVQEMLENLAQVAPEEAQRLRLRLVSSGPVRA